VDSFKETIEKNLLLTNPCHRKSWEMLKLHGTYCKKYAELYYAHSVLDIEKGEQLFAGILDWLSKTEDEIGQHFDMYVFARRMRTVMYGVQALVEKKKNI